jgi:hypothetical protein
MPNMILLLPITMHIEPDLGFGPGKDARLAMIMINVRLPSGAALPARLMSVRGSSTRIR